MKYRIYIKVLCTCLVIFASFNVFAAHETENSFVTHDKEDINYQRFIPDKDKTHALAIWMAPGFGFYQRHYDVAERLSKAGMEVWMIDIADNLFMPHNSDSMRKLDARYVRDAINQAHATTGKDVVVISQSYGAIPALKGIREWQLEKGKLSQPSWLAGAILFSPEFYAGVPALGKPPEYDPIVTATNIPVLFYQAEKLNTRWRSTEVTGKLQQGGAQVYLKMLKGVTAMFYHGDKSLITKKRLANIHKDIIRNYKLLRRTSVKAAARPMANKPPAIKRLDYKIKSYRGSAVPSRLDLMDSTGKRFVREHFNGKVTVINFWATWCPPCIKEIPSLNRLREAMKGEAFELISINYGENPEKIADFLQKVHVKFPVLLDESGAVSAKWNVLVFPSTFVIDPDGKIKYGVNAAIEWDSPEIIKKLKMLNK